MNTDFLYFYMLAQRLEQALECFEPVLSQPGLRSGLTDPRLGFIENAAASASAASASITEIREKLDALCRSFPQEEQEGDPGGAFRLDRQRVLDAASTLVECLEHSLVVERLLAGSIFPRECSFGSSPAYFQEMALASPPERLNDIFDRVEFNDGWRIVWVTKDLEHFAVLDRKGRRRVWVNYSRRPTSQPSASYDLLPRYRIEKIREPHTGAPGVASAPNETVRMQIHDRATCRVIYQGDPIQTVDVASQEYSTQAFERRRDSEIALERAREAGRQWMAHSLPRPPYYTNECWDATDLPAVAPWPY